MTREQLADQLEYIKKGLRDGSASTADAHVGLLVLVIEQLACIQDSLNEIKALQLVKIG